MAEQYVGVRIGKETYAIPILEIHEIIRMQEITYIPNSRRFVRGVINLRGQIIPVASLRECLGMPDEERSRATRIVVVNDRDSVMGMIVDSVNQVLSFGDVQPPPEQNTDGADSVLGGIGHKGDMLVSILNVEALLKD
ncbi:MAG: chemotaxis protein CheW [Bacilli bacterium]